MGSRPNQFRQADLTRALRAARAAGFERVEFNPATGVFEFLHNGVDAETPPGNFFDEKLKDDNPGSSERSSVQEPARQVADLLSRRRAQ